MFSSILDIYSVHLVAMLISFAVRECICILHYKKKNALDFGNRTALRRKHCRRPLRIRRCSTLGVDTSPERRDPSRRRIARDNGPRRARRTSAA